MTYRLTWTSTGDYFDVDPFNAEMSAWFVEQCKVHNSKFTTNVYKTDIEPESANKIMQQSEDDLHSVNMLLGKFQMPLLQIENWFDQNQLNQLHKDWIALLRNHPNIETAMFKIDEQVFNAFHRLNRQIHYIERMFTYKIRSIDSWRETNPFTNVDFMPGVFNVSLLYVDHGRSSMEKFINYDDSPNDHELSNWKTIGSALEINLSRPYQSEYPSSFLSYCNTHNIKPIDTKLPFGNLVDCKKNLANARQVMNRNHVLADNYLIIE